MKVYVRAMEWGDATDAEYGHYLLQARYRFSADEKDKVPADIVKRLELTLRVALQAAINEPLEFVEPREIPFRGLYVGLGELPDAS